MIRHLRIVAACAALVLPLLPLAAPAAGQSRDPLATTAAAAMPAENPPSQWIRAAPATARPAAAIRPLGDEVIRTRQVVLDVPALDGARAAPGATLRLDLFDDASFEGVITRIDAPGALIGRGDSYSLSGRLRGIAGGTFDLVVHRGIVAARISAPPIGDYQICLAGGGRHEVRQLDQSKLGGCGVDERTVVRAAEAPPAVKSGAPPKDDGSRIDVMLLYTPSARDEVGGTAAIEAEIMLAVTTGNSAYANSNIWTRLVIVHIGEVAYTESGVGFFDLHRLSFSADGVMDEIHPLRNMLAADNVGLFVDSNLDSCGIGFLIQDYSINVSNFSFNVTAISCAVGNFTYIHEVGHNLGCAHDHLTALPTEGAFPYSFGYLDPDLTFRTVLALPNGSPRVPWFSNPDIQFLDTGRVTGTPEGAADPADNARTIDENAFFVASFKQTICPAPVPPPGTDCNNNCIDDFDDVFGGLVPDCNENFVPDFCDVNAGWVMDCNNNRVPDECEDCNGNAIADSCEFSADVLLSSGALSPIGAGHPVQHTFTAPPEPIGNITMRLLATADIGDFLRNLTVFINDEPVEQVFRGGQQACAATPALDTVFVDAATFLALTGGPGADAVVRLEASSSVNAFACGGTSSVTVELLYETIGAAEDANDNGLPDECDRADGDITLDGVVNVADLLELLANWGPCPSPVLAPCHADITRDGRVDVFDLLTLLAGWG